MSSLSELRKELKSLRKAVMPVPVSRMKKSAVAMEVSRLRGSHHTEEKVEKKEHKEEEKAVKKVMEKAGVPKKVKEAVVKVEKAAHKKEEKVEKKEHKEEEKAVKPAKGSDEMKARMAALREKRAKASE